MKKYATMLICLVSFVAGVTAIDKKDPLFIPAGGFYNSPLDIKISDVYKNSEIYFTTDGSIPTEKSERYINKIKLSVPAVVRVMIKNGNSKFYAMNAYDFNTSYKFSGKRMQSPEWRDQIIYEILIDRFNNGDPSNDDMGKGEFGHTEGQFNGGDIAGIKNKLDYLKDLGVTALWITPPVRNQWVDGNYTGYHGYWASDFLNVDPHFGSIKSYSDFVKDAHSRGIYVIQDIVVNHMGDFIRIDKPGNYDTIKERFLLNGKSDTPAPISRILGFNDPTRLTQDEFTNYSLYNWTPEITDYGDKDQINTYQMGNLDDLCTKNENVRNLLRGYFRYWIEKADIDGYRIDTVSYVEPEFFEGFINGSDKNNAGVKVYAASLGKKDFFSFGEAWNTSDKACAAYTTSSYGDKRIDSTLYFPLAFAVRDVISNGKATALISEVLNKRYKSGYADPDRLVTFIDNHDVERILNTTDPGLVKGAYMLIMSINGVPQLYYGSEHGFTAPRSAMFRGGFASTGRTNDSDLFDAGGEWMDFFKKLIGLRKTNRVLRYNNIYVTEQTKSGPGIFAFSIKEKDKTGKELFGIDKEAFYVMNTSSEEKIFSTETRLSDGGILELQIGSTDLICDESYRFAAVGKNGSLTMRIPPFSAGIYILKNTSAGASSESAGLPVINGSFGEPIKNGMLSVTGKMPAGISDEIELIIDGSIKKPFKTEKADINGNWSSRIELGTLNNGEHTLTAVVRLGNSYLLSRPVTFTCEKPFTSAADYKDQAGDDYGYAPGKYKYPQHQSFTGGLCDIKNVKVSTSGSDIELEITMSAVSRVWKPNINQFDHVLFSIFLSDGDSTGAVYNPKHNYKLPENFIWDYMLKLEGWGTSAYKWSGADKINNGTPVTPGPTSEVDWDSKEQTFKKDGIIKIKIPGSLINNPASIKNWKIYISTWDTDMGKLRRMVKDPLEYSFGGGDDSKDPLFMDETKTIFLK